MIPTWLFKTVLWIAILLLSTLVTERIISESTVNHEGLAKLALTEFHGKFDGSDFESIYRASATESQRHVSERHFINTMLMLRDRLGEVKVSNGQSYEEGFAFFRVKEITIFRDTEYEKGQAIEKFMFEVNNTEAKLKQYRIWTSAAETVPLTPLH